ncbi:hypothetical protein [Geosporobacter ferrireducens]|uniref:Uncharacterized protein n=1 Tax=Geosporobacter ferrireducens TaxID=1424294 RepID=A0A1D8GN13_9FIRM|nr:hypothetical protein [Geosporobacter ferrireducens]AOT72298.1 hypothetical protein Gferi_23770 [Geosporobacter ferrireducens]
MDMQSLEIRSNLPIISKNQNTESVQNDLKVEKNFGKALREKQIDSIKEDIFNRFNINVGAMSGKVECHIPEDVLYRMNTDTALKKKVYDMLSDYSSDKFKMTMQTLNPPVKKCILIFDDTGEVTATLEPDVAKESTGTSGDSKNKKKARAINEIRVFLHNDIQELYIRPETCGVISAGYKKKDID